MYLRNLRQTFAVINILINLYSENIHINCNMNPYHFIYFQFYRISSFLPTNDNPKENSIYLVAIFQMINFAFLHRTVCLLIDSDSAENKNTTTFIYISASIIILIYDFKTFDFNKIRNKYQKYNKAGFLILFLYMFFSLKLLFYKYS